MPEEARRQANELFLDTLAVICAGLTHPDYAPFVDSHRQASGPATIPGIAAGVPVHSAALVNGGSTTVLQLQDGHRLARGHPASHLVPALLAIAESENLDYETMLEAFVVGYEVGARIGIALGGLNPALHDTGTWGTVAVAAAVTHLLRAHDADAIVAAIEAAAAVAPMPFRDTAAAGASIHHLYVGLGSTTGISVATAVASGLTPLPGTLEAFFGPRAGAAYQREELIRGIGSDDKWDQYELMNAYIKVHPTCAHLHGVNDAVARLIADHGLRAEQIADLDVALYGTALEFENSHPNNDLAARFSVAGSVAIALCYGELNLATLTSETLKEPAVQALMQRVHVRHDPQLDDDYPQGRPCRVSITCHDGRRLTAAVVHPLGDCTNPLSGEQRRSKVVQLLKQRFGGSGADRILDSWDLIATGESLSCLTRVLRSPAAN